MAIRLLMQKGFQLVHKNYRYGRYEVDLIVQKGNLVVFVEVKVRNSLQFGPPEAGVSCKQQERIRSVAHHYQQYIPSNTEIRFDIIGILRQGSRWEATHFEDAF